MVWYSNICGGSEKVSIIQQKISVIIYNFSIELLVINFI